ncbi:collagen-binding domain-containing protein [Companilactobacillus pabuli]|uniref:collagen-binding domain-containing protein n=1 Tax=Companilactobacillus pabuli TaxID=2714036 RepID=UPI002416A0E4|nr:collagen-binding domain-containing protein [Companilactobacillus pabuli]MDG5113050.1 LPXTG cell wall anchor domain-containing protein [Companilactobacillus pabuli]
MKMKKANILSCVAISAIVLSGMGITNVKASDNTTVSIEKVVEKSLNPEVQNGGKVSDDFQDVSKNNLGYASKFHIFAKEATLNAHTNGNLAVGSLFGNVNFGTNITDEKLLDKDISYVQEVKNMSESSFVSSNDHRTNKVVFGEVNDVELGKDNASPLVNETPINHLLNNEIFQDKDSNEYLDFDQEFAKLENKSGSLASTNSKTITNADFPDQNQRVIDLSDFEADANNQIVINLDPEVLNASTPLTISGLSADKGGTSIIINVDTKGQNPYAMNSQIKLRFNNGEENPIERPNQETEYFDDNHLLWNFYDSSAGNKQFDGIIEMNNTFQGSVLAPDATINIHHNLDGNIVAEKVNVVGGETHRWDLQDNNNIVTVPEEPGEPDENNEGKELVDPGFTIDPTPTSPEPKPSPENPDGNVDEEDKEEDDDQEIIINGGSESDLDGNGGLDLNGKEVSNQNPNNSSEEKTLSSINEGSGLVPLTNSAQSTDTSSVSGLSRLPQAGATIGILLTIIGVIMLGLGIIVKRVRS